MSDTRRYLGYGWGPGDPEFDKFYPQITTQKHAEKIDRYIKENVKIKKYIMILGIKVSMGIQKIKYVIV